MKKTTVKQKLVDYMIANGNKFTYTEMIKALLKLQSGGRHEYNWRSDRGYFATNFSGYNGYMVNGCGDCGVYKSGEGKWSAKYYTEDEKMAYKIKKIFNNLVHDVRKMDRVYQSYGQYQSQQNYIDLKQEVQKEFLKNLKKSFKLK